jgi:hypothetical protein
MKTRNLSIVLLTTLLVLACNLPGNTPTPPPNGDSLPPPVQADTPVPQPPTQAPPPSATPLPTDTPPPTATFTPTIPIAWPKDLNVNCRFGYGTEWLAIGALMGGEPAEILGRNSSSTWWYVKLQNSTQCWVAASVTETSGNVAAVPVKTQSVAQVIKVSIEKPDNISVPGCIGPIQPTELKGSVETNGPTTVDLHFETEQSGVLATQTKTFDSFDVKNASDSFVPTLTAGSYWVKLVVTTPNGKVAESGYKVECP